MRSHLRIMVRLRKPIVSMSVDEQVENKQQETKLVRSNVQSCSRNAEFENEDILADEKIIVPITKDKVEDDILLTKTFILICKGTSAKRKSKFCCKQFFGQDNNEVIIQKELGQASSTEENVPSEQESEDDKSESASIEGKDYFGEDELE